MKKKSMIKVIFSIAIGLGWLGICSSSFAVVPLRLLHDPLPIDETIRSMTKVIHNKKHSPGSYAMAHWERGLHYSRLYRYEDAISDFTTALQGMPDKASIYVDRAIAYSRLEKYASAFEDFAKAEQLSPNDIRVLKYRGALNFLLGRFPDATHDFRRYLNLEKSDIYRLVWLYFSLRYQNLSAKQDLARYSQGVNLDEWPGAFVLLFRGDIKLEDLLKALSNKPLSQGHQSEAYYYLAQHYLLLGNRDKATSYFQKSIETNAQEYLEYQFSRAYYKKLTK